MKTGIAAVLAACACLAAAAGSAYDIGMEMETEGFWKSAPDLFVNQHAKQGFKFTSGDNKGADTRLDGAVTYHGIPVYESKVVFTEDARGIARVELVLFSPAGTEVRENVDSHHYRLVHRDKDITFNDFVQLMRDVRGKLTPEGAKHPPMKSERTTAPTVQKSQTWPRTDIPTETTLTWNYSQVGRKTNTFKAGFVRVTVDGPARLAAAEGKKYVPVGGANAAKGKGTIRENVKTNSEGDVFIDNVPMVDQGQKGYCAAAASERVLRYYGVEVDEHEIAQAAGTTAGGGTLIKDMKDSVTAIGKLYKLGTVVTYGDFEKPDSERCANLAKEVANYNKAAKKLKKKEIADDVYITRRGNTTYFDPSAADAAMDPEVLKYMKTEGSQRSKFTKFIKDVHDQVNKGIPLFWGVKLGTYQEAEIPQAKGGHIRLIIGYNDKKREIIYTDSWGKGHEFKRMPAEWAWTISHCLMYLKPLR